MSENPEEVKPTLVQHIETAHNVVETISTAISIGSGVVGFIRSIGGFGQFLVEVGFFGVACYLAVFLFYLPGNWLLEKLGKATKRVTIGSAEAWIAAGTVLIGGVIIRFLVFAEGITRGGDAFGNFFMGLLGVLILLAPLLLLWYTRGSKPVKA